jgi:hypothetical protein
MTKEEIKEIAETLDCGFRCFVHKKTMKMIFIPDADRLPSNDFASWRNDEKEIREHSEDYITLTGMNSKDSFQLMVDFCDKVSDQRVKARLVEVLDGQTPFRNFKFEIDNSGALKEDWFKFKDERIRNWVEKQLRETKLL